jgi:hypothetical protein
MYLVYKHKSKDSGKVYIGYTKLTMKERFAAHIKNAAAGKDTKFYRAIRKYGIDGFDSEVLWEGYSNKEAQKKEKEFITLYDSFKIGYNSTTGGDGGWCVPAEKYEDWVKVRSMKMESNGKYSGFTDDEILEEANRYFEDNGYNISGFINYSSKKLGMPSSYSKNRFGGKKFKEAYSDKFGVAVEDMKYVKTKEHREKLSIQNSKVFWYSNDELKESKRMKSNQISEGWYRGRKYGVINKKT